MGILASEGSWYFRDIERAATARGHSCVRLDFERLVTRVGSKAVPESWKLEGGPPEDRGWHGAEGAGKSEYSALSTQYPVGGSASRGGLGQNAIDVASLDAVLVRTMPPGSLEQVVYRMDVLGRLAATGTRIVNSPKSLETAVDKFLTTAQLQAAGLPVPDTIVCEHEDDAMAAFDELGRDVVVKPLFGSEGRGIVRVSDPDLAHRTFRTLMRLNAVLYLQRFIDHEGYDVRVMVLNGRLLGGMQRQSAHDFRTNVSRNAIAALHDVTPREAELALRSAAATGVHIGGIDLLYDRQGTCFVIEVNAVPGWQAFSRTTGIDVATALIKSLEID